MPEFLVFVTDLLFASLFFFKKFLFKVHISWFFPTFVGDKKWSLYLIKILNFNHTGWCFLLDFYFSLRLISYLRKSFSRFVSNLWSLYNVEFFIWKYIYPAFYFIFFYYFILLLNWDILNTPLLLSSNGIYVHKQDFDMLKITRLIKVACYYIFLYTSASQCCTSDFLETNIKFLLGWVSLLKLLL